VLTITSDSFSNMLENRLTKVEVELKRIKDAKNKGEAAKQKRETILHGGLMEQGRPSVFQGCSQEVD
jgi:hypothetical protein